MFYLLVDEVTGVFSFLNPVIEFLEALGHIGLAIYTFIEVLLIIPPIEILYYPLILLNPDEWVLYLINVTVFNVLASILGYYIGMKIGYPVLKYLSNEELLEKTHKLFEKWGVLAVAVGAFTPIPFTIVVFLAGITRMDFKKFIFAGFLGRFPRYLLGGYLVRYVFEGINSKIDQYILILSIVGMLLFIVYYLIQGIYNLQKKR